jgi:hypothetical protein
MTDRTRAARRGLPAHEWEDKTARRGLPERGSWNRTVDRQPKQDNQTGTARTGQPNGTARKGQL